MRAERRREHVPHERLLGLTLAHDNHFDQRLRLPPTTFIFHNSPSAYSSSPVRRALAVEALEDRRAVRGAR